MVVRGLREDVVGRAFTSARVEWPPQLGPLPPEAFAARLVGQRVESLGRRGKYIIFTLNEDFFLVHLKMTGRLYVSPPGEIRDGDRWVRAAFGLDDGRELRFSDLRKFGRLRLTARLEDVIGSLGPEPLDDSFTLEAFRARLAARSGMVKPLLMNQSFVAGVGNIYADEALWRARIDPRRRVDTLKADDVERLYHAIRGALQDGIEHEGATIGWYRKPDGTVGEQQQHFDVYGRVGEPCPRCGTPLSRISLGQRGTHFCPVCQT